MGLPVLDELGNQVWPPTLAEMKIDANVPADEDRDDVAYQQNLDAAVDYVERVRGKGIAAPRFNPADTHRPLPNRDLKLGTIRLAIRLEERRRSKAGTVNMQSFGVQRIAMNDIDIERLLRIGRFALPVIA